MGRFWSAYDRIRDQIFIRKFEVLTLAGDRSGDSVDTGAGGFTLEFLDPDRLAAFYRQYGRSFSMPSVLGEDPVRHRIAGLCDGNGQVVCCGFLSGTPLDARAGNADKVLRVPWEGGLELALEPHCLYLWSFWTPPALRGAGHYTRLLGLIVEYCAGYRNTTTVIYCRSDNEPSRKAILRAGFNAGDHIEMVRLGPVRFLYSREFGRKWFMSAANAVRFPGWTGSSAMEDDGKGGCKARAVDKNTEKKAGAV